MSADATAAFRGEIEAPRPLAFPDRRIEVAGWCADAAGQAPEVRLATDGGVLTVKSRGPRAEFGGAPCGFVLQGTLPAGVHTARLEARGADGRWETIRRCTLRVATAPAAAIESPVADGTIGERARLEGWFVDPTQPTVSVEIRFGHQDVPCDPVGPREDVASSFPDVPHARHGGFITRDPLPAGHGPARVRARLADGGIRVAPTKVFVSVRADEKIPATLDLSAARVPLPGYGPPRPAPAAAPAERPRNVLFLLPGSFAANNALHTAALADALARAGHRCAIAVARDVGTAAQFASPGFTPLAHAEAAAFRFADGRAADVVHAWTTREGVRRLAADLRARHACRVVVHLEDNEQELLAKELGRPWAELQALATEELDRLVPEGLTHPHRSRDFLAAADGVTVITPRLREWVPAGPPCHVLRPAADQRYFHPRPVPAEFRAALGLKDHTVVVYPGNVHASNAAEVGELYAAVGRLNAEGVPVMLIRSGRDAVPVPGAEAVRARGWALELGPIPHHRHLPPLLALADILVQPGVPDAFNDFRLPSKLPEFFALGRPVVLPRTNLGTEVRHGLDAYVLDRADAGGIAEAVRALRADPALAARLADGAARFAEAHFSWERSAQALAKFYDALATS